MNSTSTKPDLGMNANWSKAIVDAVVLTFTEMCGMEPFAGVARINSATPIHSDVSGIINLVQERVEGVLVVSFPKETIYHVLARIYGTEFHDVNRRVQDAVGEFTNVIYSTMKTSLNKGGHKLKMALPNVIIGDQHKVVSPTLNGTTMTIPFNFGPVYTFHITVQMQN
jgi:chemotaxis protein CheX